MLFKIILRYLGITLIGYSVLDVKCDDSTRGLSADDSRGICDHVTDCGITNYTSAKQGTKPFELCCPDCACGPECVVSCCLDELYEGMLAIDVPHINLDMESCYSHTTEQLNIVRAYYMVDKCPQISGEDTDNLDCGNEGLYLWGTLLPIFSPAHKKIYKNKACADCHNVTDGITWTLSINVVLSDGTDTLNMLLNGIDRGFFQVSFDYPGKQRDVVDKRCNTEIKRSCALKENEFSLVKVSNYTPSEIVDMCLNGAEWNIQSGVNVYYNIFCQVCSSEVLVIECDDYGSRTDQAVLTWILDISKIAFFEKNGNLQVPTYSDCVQHQRAENEHDCYRKLCPIGRIPSLDSNGDCEFMSEEWNAPVFIVTVTLRPKERIKFQAFEVVTDYITRYGGLPTETMKLSPWGDNWKIQRVHYAVKTEGSVEFLVEVILRLKFLYTKVRMERFIEQIETAMSKQWVLRFKSSAFVFDQAFQTFGSFAYEERKSDSGFSRGQSLVSSQQQQSVQIPLWAKYTDHIMFKERVIEYYRYRQITHPKMSMKSVTLGGAVLITKLFFCYIRDLHENNLLILGDYDALVLFHVETGQFYFNLEFEETTASSGKRRFRVCVPSHGENPGSLASSGSTISLITHTLSISAVFGVIVIKV